MRHYMNTEPTGIRSIGEISSAAVLINAEDPSFNACRNSVLSFFRGNGIKIELFFLDFSKIDSGERLLTSVNSTILQKDLNWFGLPAKEKRDLILGETYDLFISLYNDDDYTSDFISSSIRARFKIGRRQLPGQIFDIVMNDPAEEPLSEADVFGKIITLLESITKS